MGRAAGDVRPAQSEAQKAGVRELVTLLEQTVVNTLAEYGIDAHPRADAPGVYVGEMKICSLGLRIRKGCSFHGLALNINMDLAPFQRITPAATPAWK
jgi:lipoyl(octanoyl) transferase